MSIFSSLQIASNAMQAQQIGLQVVGNNIANANTPGYIRQSLNLSPVPPQRVGELTLGLGVHVDGITQQIDRFLEERLRGSGSELANGEAQEGAYAQLEAIIGELSETDLSSSLSTFFGGIHDILNQPDSVSVRNLAVLQGETLSDEIRGLSSRVLSLRDDADNQIKSAADDVNSLIKKIAGLNFQIQGIEGGTVTKSDAVGLRDERGKALRQLSEWMDIRVSEQDAGDVLVFSGGEYLVFNAQYREVKTAVTSVEGLDRTELRFAETDAPLNIQSGKLAGLTRSRDTVLGGFATQLDSFAKTLMFEFNKVYSSGQGLTGYGSITSEFFVNDAQSALDEAGLEFTPVNGEFQIRVFNKQTGLTSTKDIKIDLNGLDGDTTLESLAAEIDAIAGISASIDDTRHLQIDGDSSIVSFSFADDTSGVLAALGINTFFSGTGATNVGVSDVLRDDPAKFAASSGGIGEDSLNAERLATLLTSPLETQNGESIAVLYDRLTSDVAQGASVAKSLAQGNRDFHSVLEGQHLSITGVSIDEEVVRMISYQRAFQASARMISTLSELLDILVRL